jgi:PIN domain nuclease of toxin-antitoxin system
MTSRGRLLLDTHIWVWYVEDEAERFSRRIEPVVEAAARREAVIVSAISVWEVGLLDAGGRLQLSAEIRAWTARALRLPGIRFKGLTPSVAIESTRLPGDLHRDPADRILIATARVLAATLVTCDERIIDYGAQGHVNVLDARP